MADTYTTTTAVPSLGSSVVLKGGVYGEVEEIVAAETAPGVSAEPQVGIRLHDGRRMIVPAGALTLWEGGIYYLPLGVESPEGQPSTPEVAAIRAVTAAPVAEGPVLQDRVVVPVVAEELRVEKRTVETGSVRIRKTVHERQEQVDIPLLREEVDVERVPVGQVVTEAPPVRQEGDTTIVPLLEEVLVVEKRLLIKEELRITRRRTETRQPQTVTLRTEEAHVERLPARGVAAEEDGVR